MRALTFTFFLLALLLDLGIAKAWADSGEWTQDQRVNAQNFIDAVVAHNEAAQILNNGGAGSLMSLMTAEEEKSLIAKLQEAYEHANAVRDDVLDKIHPDLKHYWKDKFTEGLRLELSNLSGKGDVVAEVKGSALLDEFGDWLQANGAQIQIPK